MTYSEYQYDCAKWGMVFTPLTLSEFNGLRAAGLSDDDLISVGQDIHSGFSLEQALTAL